LLNLEEFDCSDNQLWGNIPNFKNLPNLRVFICIRTQISGNIPDFNNLPNLQVFYCGNNQLNGSIPNFSNLQELQFFSCSKNLITNSIPDFNSLPKLQSFDCYQNQLSGNIPDFKNLPNLRTFYCDSNQLTGTIPNFTNLPKLQYFACSENQLSGTIPNFTNLPNLQSLWCYKNQLSGSIPNFTNLPNLQLFTCSRNQLSGSVPNFTNLPNLQNFWCYKNQLSGSIPNFNLPKITNIQVDNNRFESTTQFTKMLLLGTSTRSSDSLTLYRNHLTFDDIIPNMPLINGFNGGKAKYAPQDSIFRDTTITRTAGQSLTIDLGIDAGISTNVYQWYKNGNPWTPPAGNSSNANKLIFNSLQNSDAGTYHVRVTNPGAPALTLHSRAIRLNLGSATCTVTTTADSGPGSLREAINCANSNPGVDTIKFNIPGAGPHTIRPASALPEIRSTTILNATTQPGWSLGNIILDGTTTPGNVEGLTISYNSGSAVYGMVIRNFKNGRGLNCYQDTSLVIGAPGKGNAIYGNADLMTFSQHEITIQECVNTTIQGNIIGLSETLTLVGDPQDAVGIGLEGKNIKIGGNRSANEGNRFGGTFWGINAYDGNNGFTPQNYQIYGNDFGVFENSALRCNTGIGVIANIDNFMVGDGSSVHRNRFYSQKIGISVFSANNPALSIRYNEFFCNDSIPIERVDLAVPVISSASPLSVSGTTAPGALVEVYLSDPCTGKPCQGYARLGVATANASGIWQLFPPYETPVSSGLDVTATATLNNRTSRFGACVKVGPLTCTVTTTADSGPGSLREAINCANSNPGADTIRFDIPGTGPHVIAPLSNYPNITGDSTVIDATTQPGWSPGNIVLDGINLSNTQEPMLRAWPASGTVSLPNRGFELYGILIKNVPGNALNITYARDFKIGAVGKGNVIYETGRLISTGATGIQIWRCVNGVVSNNILGADQNLVPAVKRSGAGIAIWADTMLITENIVKSPANGIVTLWYGPYPDNNYPDNITIIKNDISLCDNGVLVNDYSSAIRIGSDNANDENIIWNNSAGILIDTTNNQAQIARNQFICNTKGIFYKVANARPALPIIISANTNVISGTATPNSTVRLFINNAANCPATNCQGSIYLGTTTSDATGKWLFNSPFANALSIGNNITVTATTQGITSEFTACVTVTAPTCNQATERAALIALYDATGGDNWTNKTNWKTAAPVSQWYGIQVNNNGCVQCIGLDGDNIPCNAIGTISGNNLTNILPTSIGAFSELKVLNLYNNNLSGSIPTEIEQLSNLEVLVLDNNNLTGSIPPQLGNLNKLTSVGLGANQLSGTIPAALANADSLAYIFLQGNKTITGTIPSELFSMPNLRGLYLQDNDLYGEVPLQIVQAQKLETFFISKNRITNIPDMSGLPFIPDNPTGFYGLRIFENGLTFRHILPNITPLNQAITVNKSRYADQDSIFSDTTITRTAGQALTIDLGIDAGLTTNAYQWYKNGNPWTPPAGNSSNSNKLIFSSLQNSDAGTYHVRVTNPGAPALTLHSRAIRLNLGSATCTVTTTADSGPGSLREAINCANSNPGPDTIRFNIAGAGPHVIRLSNFIYMSQDTGGLVIDATTQPGWQSGGMVIDGSNTTNAIYGLFNMDDCRGLEFYGFVFRNAPTGALGFTRCSKVRLGAPGKGNYFYANDRDNPTTFGTNPANFSTNVQLFNCTEAVIQSNYFGITETNAKPVTNMVWGLTAAGQNILIGGSRAAGEGNTFGYALFAGLGIWGDAAVGLHTRNVRIEGNNLGTDATGTQNWGNGFGFNFGVNGTNSTLEQVRFGDGTADRSNLLKYNQRAVSTYGTSGTKKAIFLHNIYVCNEQAFEGDHPARPVQITAATTQSIRGTAQPNDSVEVYLSQNSTCPTAACQGSVWLGLTRANAAGDWTLTAPFAQALTGAEQVTALGTGGGITGAFAPCFRVVDVNSCRYQDSLELVKLYNATDGPNWINKWDLNKPMSTWYGIQLTVEGCVRRIDLSTNSLTGTLPNLNLPNLEILDLDNNQLSGSVPNFDLPKLLVLDLDNNQLAGAIPNFNLPVLQYLSLAINQLTGSLPPFNQVPLLQSLFLYQNNLEGIIPNYNLPHLTKLQLDDNALSGTLPIFSGIPLIEYLHIDDNQLSGTIPIFNLPNLISLHLDKNSLTGSIPVLNAPNLQEILLNNNQLSGCFDPALNVYCNKNYNFLNNPLLPWQGDYLRFCNGENPLGASCNDGNTSTVNDVVQANCTCTGSVFLCDTAAEREALIALYDATNGDNWTNKTNWKTAASPSTWYGITVNPSGCISGINLDNNALSGALASDLGNLSQLTTLILRQNPQLSGGIPTEIGKLNLLETLMLDFNNLSGTVPASIGNLFNLKTLWLGSNAMLGGEIPASFSNLINLEYFALQGCQFSGNIPFWIGNFSKLINLGLNENQFSGQIPGSLGNLSQLKILWLGGNQLQGPIPSSLGNLTNLELLSLYNNLFKGPSPAFFGTLPKLKQLYITVNKFTTLPNLATVPIAQSMPPNNPGGLLVGDNALTFEDVLINIGKPSYSYAPQDSIFSDTTITRAVNQSLTIDLGIDAGISTNVYQWYKNGQLWQTVTGDNKWMFNNLILTDAGEYWVHVTNPNAPLLTLKSRKITLVVNTCTTSSPPVISGPTTFCPGSSTALAATAGFTQYAWSSGQTTANITANAAQTYTVTVRDAGGCTGTASVTVTQSTTLSPQITGSTTFCPGGSTALAATAGFTQYVWSSGQTTANIAANAAQTYTVTVRDAGGCTGTASVAITQGSGLNADAVTVPSTTCNGGNGSATASASGGTVPYRFLWSNGSTTASITGLLPGTYTVTILDAGTCSTTVSVTIANQGSNPTRNLRRLICYGDSVRVAGGVYKNSGQYPYIQKGQNGACDTVVTLDLNVQRVSASLKADPPALCGKGRATLTLSVSDCPGCDYDWPAQPTWTGAGPHRPTVEKTTTYTVTAASENGCTATTAVTVRVWAGDTVRIDSILCPGQSVLFCGLPRRATGRFVCKGISSDGCDSVTVLQLTVLDPQKMAALPDTFATTFCRAASPGKSASYAGRAEAAPKWWRIPSSATARPLPPILSALILCPTPCNTIPAALSACPVRYFFSSQEIWSALKN
jgi:Leucine-rich repeat (LRR) protein